MAILKQFWLNGARKSVSDGVLYKLKGQQVLRSKAAQVENPRSVSQMDQRTRLGNVVAMYRANKPWLPKAFSVKNATWSNYNAWVSANLPKSFVYLTKSEVGAGACVLAPYTISRGSLPQIPMQLTDDGILGGLFFSQSITRESTIGQLSASIILANPYVQAGDQLSFIINKQSVLNGIPYVTAEYYEIIMDVNDTKPVSEVISDEILVTGGQFMVDGGGYTGENAMGFAMLWSREVGSKVLTSDATLMLTDLTYYNTMISDEHRADALASYGNTDAQVFLEAGYMGDNAAMTSAQRITDINNVTPGGVLVANSVDGEIGMISEDPWTILVHVKRAITEGQVIANPVVLTYDYAPTFNVAETIERVNEKTISITSKYGIVGANIARVSFTIDGEEYSAAFAKVGRNPIPAQNSAKIVEVSNVERGQYFGKMPAAGSTKTFVIKFTNAIPENAELEDCYIDTMNDQGAFEGRTINDVTRTDSQTITASYTVPQGSDDQTIIGLTMNYSVDGEELMPFIYFAPSRD